MMDDQQALPPMSLIWIAAAGAALLDAIGSAAITELGTRVLVMALAAMSLNFLLGFTGVLSFGHAAYFGLGAYGVPHDHQIPRPRAPRWASASACLSAPSPRAIIGALIVRLRGVYFAMVTIAFGQVFYLHRLPLEPVTPAAMTG